MILERINSFNSRKVPCAYVITKDEKRICSKNNDN